MSFILRIPVLMWRGVVRFPSMLPVALVIFGALVNSCFGDEPLSPEDVRRLIRTLASDSFAEREVAFSQLLAQGRKAVNYLREAENDSDFELRHRVQELLQSLDLPLAPTEVVAQMPEAILTMAESHSRKLMVFAGGQRFLQGSWREGNEFSLHVVSHDRPMRLVHEHSKAVRTLAFSKDDSLLVSGDLAGRVLVWNVPELDRETPTPHRVLRTGNGPVTSVHVSPDERFVFVACQKGILQKWEIETGSLVQEFDFPMGQSFETMALTENGLVAYVAGSGPIVFRVDLLNGAKTEFKTGRTMINTVALSPDERFLAVGGPANGVEFWNLETLALERQASTTQHSIYSVVWRSNTSVLVGAEDGRILAMDDFGVTKRSFGIHAGATSAVLVRPDSSDFLSGGHDGRVLRFKLVDDP